MGVLPCSDRLTCAMDTGVLQIFRQTNLRDGYGSVAMFRQTNLCNEYGSVAMFRQANLCNGYGNVAMFKQTNLCDGYESVQIQYLCSTKGLLKQSKYTEKHSQDFLKYLRN